MALFKSLLKSCPTIGYDVKQLADVTSPCVLFGFDITLQHLRVDDNFPVWSRPACKFI